MKCKRCKRECLESELTNGFCSDCIEKYGNDPEELKNIRNPVANEFNIISIIIDIVGLILGLYCFFSGSGVLTGILCMGACFTISLFYKAVKEIIQLLEEIKNK